MSNKGNPTYGSLFAGVGGIDIGFDKANWDCKFQVEWDKHCQQTLAYHWPDVPRWGDVSDVKGDEIPPVDLITFGSPCQDLSLAGKRAGLMNGSRSNLFFEATRIIKEMRNATGNVFPKWAIWENVPGAFSSNNGDDLEAVIQEMVDIGGHHVEWHCVDAQFFGVPQRRRRVFVIACFDSAILNRGGKEILPIGQGRRRNSATRIKKREDIALAFGDSVETGSSSFRMKAFGDYAEDDMASALKARDYKDATDIIVEPMIIDGTRVDDVRVYESPVQTLKARMGTGGNNVPIIATNTATIPIDDVREVEKHQNGTGIGNFGDPAYTLDTISAAGIAYTPSSFASYQEGVGTLRANGGDLGGGSESLIVQPDIAPTLRSGGDGRVPSSRGEHLVVEAYDEYNDSLGGNIHQALRAGTKQSTGVLADMVVRRLTPIECERLMGWPDNHTLHRADGTLNSDTTRYKMCGNGVASPVAEFIGRHLYDAHNDL